MVLNVCVVLLRKTLRGESALLDFVPGCSDTVRHTAGQNRST